MFSFWLSFCHGWVRSYTWHVRSRRVLQAKRAFVISEVTRHEKNRNIKKSAHECHVITACDLSCGRCTDICRANLIRCSHSALAFIGTMVRATCASFAGVARAWVPQARPWKPSDRCKPAPRTHFSEPCLRLRRNDAPLRPTGLCLTALSYLITISDDDMH